MRGYNVEYKQCVSCIMDSNDDPFITFNDEGVCNHCTQYKYEEEKFVFTGKEGEENLQRIISKIKAEGKGKKYDCIIGISGGVDSTYLAWVAKQHGIRALGVHCDNGWNSELAVKNIESIVSTLDMDLYTYVIDWEEFKDIQLAYFKADVIDIEAITDIAFRAVLQQTAFKYKIKYFLSGDNIVTESVLPQAWICKDTSNLLSIHEKFGTRPISTFPVLRSLQSMLYKKMVPTEGLAILNTMEYKKDEVKAIIMKELGWRDYGGKHFESVFTRFYQAYILPQKFGVDKRKAHLSNLICSGQITREQALDELREPIYDNEMYKSDREFVLKKLSMTDTEFDEYISRPPVPHKEYGLGITIYDKYKFLKVFRPLINKLK